MQSLFKSASLKLTGWYLLIIMLISLLFSVVIYAVSSSELERRLPREGFVIRGVFVDDSVLEAIQRQRAADARRSLIANLTILNVVTLAAGGAASYALARRTLRPIEEAADAQGRFIGDASHELRTPLAVMKSELEVTLRNPNVNKQELKALAMSNLEEVNNLEQLAERLLQLSLGSKLEKTVIEIMQPALDAVGKMMPRAEEKNISIENQLTSAQALTNEQAVGDVAAILLDNAIKYSPEGSTIIIKTFTEGRSSYIEVADNGVGISTEDQAHIFDRFYRADDSRTKGESHGYGLGLSIAKQVTNKLGGELSVKSTLGKGSIFTLKLPSSPSPH